MKKIEKRKHVADFNRRAKDGDTTVTDLRDLGRYISVNPMADEDDLLRQLGISRESCTKVDLYWHFKDDVWFVQLQGKLYSDRSIGIYARIASNGYMNIVAALVEEAISSATVEKTLRRISLAVISVDQLDEELRFIGE